MQRPSGAAWNAAQRKTTSTNIHTPTVNSTGSMSRERTHSSDLTGFLAEWSHGDGERRIIPLSVQPVHHDHFQSTEAAADRPTSTSSSFVITASPLLTESHKIGDRPHQLQRRTDSGTASNLSSNDSTGTVIDFQHQQTSGQHGHHLHGSRGSNCSTKSSLNNTHYDDYVHEDDQQLNCSGDEYQLQRCPPHHCSSVVNRSTSSSPASHIGDCFDGSALVIRGHNAISSNHLDATENDHHSATPSRGIQITNSSPASAHRSSVQPSRTATSNLSRHSAMPTTDNSALYGGHNVNNIIPVDQTAAVKNRKKCPSTHRKGVSKSRAADQHLSERFATAHSHKSSSSAANRTSCNSDNTSHDNNFNSHHNAKSLLTRQLKSLPHNTAEHVTDQRNGEFLTDKQKLHGNRTIRRGLERQDSLMTTAAHLIPSTASGYDYEAGSARPSQTSQTAYKKEGEGEVYICKRVLYERPPPHIPDNYVHSAGFMGQLTTNKGLRTRDFGDVFRYALAVVQHISISCLFLLLSQWVVSRNAPHFGGRHVEVIMGDDTTPRSHAGSVVMDGNSSGHQYFSAQPYDTYHHPQQQQMLMITSSVLAALNLLLFLTGGCVYLALIPWYIRTMYLSKAPTGQMHNHGHGFPTTVDDHNEGGTVNGNIEEQEQYLQVLVYNDDDDDDVHDDVLDHNEYDDGTEGDDNDNIDDHSIDLPDSLSPMRAACSDHDCSVDDDQDPNGHNSSTDTDGGENSATSASSVCSDEDANDDRPQGSAPTVSRRERRPTPPRYSNSARPNPRTSSAKTRLRSDNTTVVNMRPLLFPVRSLLDLSRSFGVILAVLLVLSPVLGSITAAYDRDTTWALILLLVFVHLVLADYDYLNANGYSLPDRRWFAFSSHSSSLSSRPLQRLCTKEKKKSHTGSTDASLSDEHVQRATGRHAHTRENRCSTVSRTNRNGREDDHLSPGGDAVGYRDQRRKALGRQLHRPRKVFRHDHSTIHTSAYVRNNIDNRNFMASKLRVAPATGSATGTTAVNTTAEGDLAVLVTNNVSTNAALVATVLLASQVTDPLQVVLLLSFGLLVFTLSPLIRHRVRYVSRDGHQALSYLLCGVCFGVMLALRKTFAAVAFAAAMLIICGAAPYIFVTAHNSADKYYKTQIRGPWDEAKPANSQAAKEWAMAGFAQG